MREKIINITIIVLLILLTVSTIFYLEDIDAIKSKILLILSGILLVLLIIEDIKCDNFNCDQKDRFAMAYGTWITISLMFSNSFRKSVLGEEGRYEGVLAMYAYIILFFCAKKHIKKENMPKLYITFQIIYIINCILGIVQNYLKLSNGWIAFLFKHGVAGTFGNVNFMGCFICIGLPFFVLSFILNNDKLSLFTSSISFYCLIGCLTRSAWVGFGVFFICLVIYLIKNFKKEYLIRTIIIFSIFSIIFTYMFVIEKRGINNKFDSIKKDISVMSTDGIDAKLGSGRIAIWKVCLEVLRKTSYSWSWT